MENLTAIEVFAKTTEDNLRSKNAEFLAKYPTEDAQITYYTKLAMKVFEDFQIDGTFAERGVRKNVEVWFRNKRTQMDLFRKHPYWNEEAKAIVFTHTEVREINYLTAKQYLEAILVYARNKLKDNSYDGFLVAIYEALSAHQDNTGFLTEKFVEYIKRRSDTSKLHRKIQGMLKIGTKITKLVRQACTQYHMYDDTIVDITTLVDEHEEGDRNYQSFEKMYARFADALSELTIKRITMISLHFCDFMLMSNGNSWLSCHYINSHNIFHEHGINSYSGCRKQGCLSYALDEPSFLFYTLPSTYDGDEYYRQEKLNRMCCQYKEGILVTGKCYPNNEDTYITRYRQTLQYIISSIENIPNSWTFSRNANRVQALVQTDERSAHYRDYEMSDQKPTISICKNFGIDLDNLMMIGHEGYCVHCGEPLNPYGDSTGWLQCDEHRIKPICSQCGRYIEDEDERHIFDGTMYCTDCIFYCDYHDRYEPITDEIHTLELEDGTTIRVCDYASNEYVLCAACNKWILRSDAWYFRGNWYCEDGFNNVQNTQRLSGKIEVVSQDTYEVGDYVLMADSFAKCRFYVNEDMVQKYPNRIARIVDKDERGCQVKIKTHGNAWWFSPNCFVGKIYGDYLNDDILGKFIEEV